VDMENILMAMPGVAEAAVIGVNHPRWQERPLACVVKKAGTEITRDDVIKFLSDKVAKWWLPDDVVFLDAIPKTSVGKFDKKVLRVQFENYQLPG
jgi:acyl-CoA synthetase (AMP-forming)/AMP-acid ligase II